MRRVLPSLFVAALALSPSLASVARAQVAGPGASEDEAVKLYGEGSDLLVQGEAAAALEKLRRSAELLPSPNTDLLIGHALRLAGRKVEAIETYERVVADAGERVRAGEERYKTALADSGRWVAVLRSELGEIEIVVRGAKAGATISVGGASTKPEREGDALRVRVYREPGSLAVEVLDDGQPAISETVTLTAGKKRQLRFDLANPAKAVGDAGERGVPTASWVAGGVGAAGFVTFAIFGGLSLGNRSSLSDCSGKVGQAGCTDGDLEAAVAAGKRNQLVANLGVVVGAAGLVAATAFFVFTPRRAAAASAASVAPASARRSGALGARAAREPAASIPVAWAGAPANAPRGAAPRTAPGSWSVGLGPLGGSLRGTF